MMQQVHMTLIEFAILGGWAAYGVFSAYRKWADYIRDLRGY